MMGEQRHIVLLLYKRLEKADGIDRETTIGLSMIVKAKTNAVLGMRHDNLD